jgi:hypothetical protein
MLRTKIYLPHIFNKAFPEPVKDVTNVSDLYQIYLKTLHASNEREKRQVDELARMRSRAQYSGFDRHRRTGEQEFMPFYQQPMELSPFVESLHAVKFVDSLVEFICSLPILKYNRKMYGMIFNGEMMLYKIPFSFIDVDDIRGYLEDCCGVYRSDDGYSIGGGQPMSSMHIDKLKQICKWLEVELPHDVESVHDHIELIKATFIERSMMYTINTYTNPCKL